MRLSASHAGPIHPGPLSPGTTPGSALLGRYGHVLETYWTRPAFRVLTAGVIFFLFLVLLFSGERLRTPLWFWMSLELVLVMLAAFLPAGFVAALVGHVREQLENSRSALTPHFRTPHLLVGAAVFGALLAIPVPVIYYVCTTDADFRQFPPSLVGIVAVPLTLLTATAWLSALSRNAWLSLLLAPLVILVGTQTLMQDVVGLLMLTPQVDFSRVPPDSEYAVYARRLLFIFSVARPGLLVANVVALVWLGWRLARAGVERRGLQRWRDLWRRVAASRRIEATRSAVDPEEDKVTGAGANASLHVPLRPHREITGLWARALHRRRAAGLGTAPWLLAAALAAVLVLVPLLFHDAYFGNRADPLRSLVIAAIIPAVALGLSWRERRAALAFESLFPSTRPQFVKEMALAMALDLAVFWVACTAAALLPLAIWDRETLLSERFAMSLLATALMQGLAFGVTFLAARFRAWAVHAIVLIALLVLMVGPLPMVWPPDLRIAPAALLAIAVVELACGIALALAACAVWRRGELA